MGTSAMDYKYPQTTYLTGKSYDDDIWDQNGNNLSDNKTEQSDVPALFRCNACYIKFTEEEALEDHILALHSSGNPHTEAENLNKCKTFMDMKYPYAYEADAGHGNQPVNYGTRFKNDVLHNDNYIEQQVPSEHANNFPSSKVLLKIPNPDSIKIGPPVLQPILTADKKFKCNLCEKKFTRKESLQYHFFSHTGEKPFTCAQCGASFRAKPTLRNHIKVVHDGNIMNMKTIKETSKTLLKLPQQVKPDKITAICSLCSKRFKNKFRLNMHMHTQHGDLPFECSVCLKKFPIISRLEVHMRLHTDEQIDKKPEPKEVLVSKDTTPKLVTEAKPYPCHICKKTFTKQLNLHNHMMTQHKNTTKNFRCSVCDQTFATKLAVKDHMRKHVVTKHPSIETIPSPKEFRQSNTLNQQNISNNFRCPQCHVSFHFLCRLKAHMFKCHSKKIIKRKQCPALSLKLKPKATSQNHNLKLAARKCHECPQCGKKFTMEKNLQTHITYTHRDGEMRYQCSKCDKSFHYNCRLKLHLLKVHKSDRM